MKIRMPAALDAEAAAREVHRLCTKIAEQVDKAQWWNAMANATELVGVCQDGCRAVIDRVAKRRAVAKKNTAKTKKRTRAKK
jgi:hypothetical protein